MTMLVDTHAHLNFEAFDDDRDQVIERCENQGMKIINVGAQFETSRLAVELAEDYNILFAAIGLHPIHVFDEDFHFHDYQNLLSGKVVAVGETGLDYYHPTFKRAGAETRSVQEVIAKQREVFIEHINFAKECDLPLICHGRNGLADKNAYQDILETLLEYKVQRAVIHCYGGNLQTAWRIIDSGYYIGIDGPVTFIKKAEQLQAIAQEIPLEKILIETDCPYLAPEPFRGKRNEPIYVEHVAEKIAKLKNISKEEVIEHTWQNAKDLFRL